eukprot:7420732-Pyramimonas_sp.AAC.1
MMTMMTMMMMMMMMMMMAGACGKEPRRGCVGPKFESRAGLLKGGRNGEGAEKTGERKARESGGGIGEEVDKAGQQAQPSM